MDLRSGYALSAEVPLPNGTPASMIVFRWPPLPTNRDSEDVAARRRAARAAAMCNTHTLLAAVPANRLLLLFGDANGCPGGCAVPNVTGAFGQGPLTPGGEELIDFASDNRLRIMGTWFYKPDGRATTWHHPGSGAPYTLDHVLVRSRDACHVIDVSPVSLPECYSDHRLVRFTVNPARGRDGHARRGHRAALRGGGSRRYNISRLEDETTRSAFTGAVEANITALPHGVGNGESLDATERELVSALRSAADTVLGHACSARRRLGWQAAHADELRAMAAARRELAARPGLSGEARRAARRALRGAATRAAAPRRD
eukprot:gene7448-9246_t